MSEKTEGLRRAMRRGDLTCGARLLLWEIAQWTSDDDDVCVRTHQQLADSIGAHRISVLRWFKELREKGLVSNETHKKVHAYTLRLSAVEVGR